VVAYLTGLGLAADSPNFTLSSFGGHPDVKGNGYVPYYMVFDHRGKLAHHHMGGKYHGGDGLAMIEWVDRLLAEAPAIWLGEEPFVHFGELAEKVSSGKDLPGAIAEIETALDNIPGREQKAELERLEKALEDYRDRRLGAALRMLGSRPSVVVPALEKLLGELSGSSLAGLVEAGLEELEESRELKDAITMERNLDRVDRSLARLKPCRACKRAGRKSFVAGCGACREENRHAIEAAVERLTKLIEKNADLPITTRARNLLDSLK
jgi:hypothetical protein